MRNPPSNPWDYNTYYDDHEGNRYHWDPDFQCWYQVLSEEQYKALPHWKKYGWLYVSAGISIATVIWMVCLH